MYLIIVIGFVSIVGGTVAKKLPQYMKFPIFFIVYRHYIFSICYYGHHRNNRTNTSYVLEFLLIAVSENIYFMWSIIVLSWHTGQWQGSGKKS